MTPAQRGRPRSFDRDKALDQAVRAFWENGYEATPMADLKERMGVTAPSIYAAFGDKLALFTEVVEKYSATYGGFMARALAEEPTAREGVARMLREVAVEYTSDAHPRGCLVISAASNCASEEVKELLRDRREANIADLAQLIQRDVEAGLLPPTTEALAVARYYGAVVQGMSQQARDGVGHDGLRAIAEMAITAWPG